MRLLWQPSPLCRICSRRRYDSYALLRNVGGGLVSTLSSDGRRRRRQWRSLSTTTNKTTTIAILRETYAPWERRAPLSPSHVQELLAHHGNNHHSSSNSSSPPEKVRVLVQPCKRRIFGNHLYQQAGAIVQDDISSADIILGVKRPMDAATLLAHKTYLFFSHTIKGQAENMDLLATCLNRHIQLLDYERMMKNSPTSTSTSTATTTTTTTTTTKPQRLVTFGRFAGLAGAIDSFHAMGRRLLYLHGMSTPFLSCAPAILHNDSLELAKDRVLLLGEALFCDGIPMSEPLVIAVTGGPRGCVFSGVMEILSLLPHEIVQVDDLPRLFQNQHHQHDENDDASGTNRQHKVHIVPVSSADIYEKKRQDDDDATGLLSSSSSSSFDRADFEQNPSHYKCTFHEKVAPYMHTLMNCVYWDARFPRLLTKPQLQRLYQEIPHYDKRLLLVSDISCDVNGSIEFLERTCTIEKPFFQYDPIEQREVASDIGHVGVTVMGTDILPSELPRESSEHFGQAVLGVVRELVQARCQESSSSSQHGVNVRLLSPGLSNACITRVDGTLEDGYRYLGPLMSRAAENSRKRAAAAVAADASSSSTIVDECSMDLSLVGHLFDSGLINQVMDVIERHGCSIDFRDCNFPTNSNRQSTMSSVVLHITSSPENKDKFDLIESEIQTLIAVFVKANATMKRLNHHANGTGNNTYNNKDQSGGGTRLAQVSGSATADKKVLVLGAGFVAKSTVDLLGRSTLASIKVASDCEEDARRVARAAKRGSHVALDAANDIHRLSELIDEADVVVSLLPAPMHPTVARECIRHGTHLVTASYESAEMRAMKGEVAAAGLVFLNEVGLDPGLDHMSAMKIVDDIHDRGGTVTGFSSVCGGLPAPAFADNPLGYKFSWSPKGVIRASRQGARYRWEDRVVEVQEGGELLNSASPFFEAWPDLGLECLPNRDSLAYEKVYGIAGPKLKTMFRGTLRYRGFSSIMSVFQNMGLLDETEHDHDTWQKLMEDLGRGFRNVDDFVLSCSEGNIDKAEAALQTLQWLDVLGNRPLSSAMSSTVMDSFANVLQEKLQYKPDEYDMIVMHHTISAVFAASDGGGGTEQERHLASLQVFGDAQTTGMSAMSKTVGYTTAACTEQILTGSLIRAVGAGLILPTNREIYEPVLAAVEKEGIRFQEKKEVHLLPTVLQEGY